MPLPDFLLNRYKDWKNNFFLKNKKTFQSLVNKGQKPKSMIISCCDSRINTNNIFCENIGEIFEHRNIANLIHPPDNNQDYISTLASVEYAVKVLKVKNIIILGHSNCGGIKYMFERFIEKKTNNEYKFLNNWLKNFKPSFNNSHINLNRNEKIRLLEKESIISSISNLERFPIISESIKFNKIKIFGLWLDISTGSLFILNKDKKEFQEIDY